MTDAEILTKFFSAWGMTDADERRTVLEACITADGVYADPYCPVPIAGPAAVSEMLINFSDETSNGTATPVGEASAHNGFIRMSVLFESDGEEIMRGQYFAQRDGDKLRLAVGFAETGDDR